MQRFRLSFALLLLLTTGSIAEPSGDISFEVTTTQLINPNWKLNDRPSRQTWKGVVGEHGLMVEGQPTMRWNTYNRTSHGGGGWNNDGVRRIQDGFVIENTSSGGGFVRSTIRFQGNRCLFIGESNFSTFTGTCRIVSRGLARQAPDNPEACQAIMEAKVEIEALLSKESAESCATSTKIEKLSKSIRGANCASKMGEIDRVLKRHNARACRDEYYRRRGYPSEIGVRG